MNPDHLSAKLAVALDEIVPPGFSVRESGGSVVIEGGGYRVGAEVADFVDAPGSAKDNAYTAAWEALSLLQDYIARTLVRPWPETKSSVALPTVRVTETEICMWFEEPDGTKIVEAPVINW